MHHTRDSFGGQEHGWHRAAIVNDPKILVADEPTGDLDRRSADEILNLLETLNKELQKTIVVVTHDPVLPKRASVVRRLEKGRLA